jgi:hypothetical protein
MIHPRCEAGIHRWQLSCNSGFAWKSADYSLRPRLGPGLATFALPNLVELHAVLDRVYKLAMSLPEARLPGRPSDWRRDHVSSGLRDAHRANLSLTTADTMVLNNRPRFRNRREHEELNE